MMISNLKANEKLNYKSTKIHNKIYLQKLKTSQLRTE